MNIKEAKVQIGNAVKAYFTKDEFGNYMIPIERQRPIFMMGPPGIGKTAIMEQIAEELGLGLISYSMTHHTRQSALGLPFIEKKVYGDKEYSVSEYTMSEIIASVYDVIANTGKKEGILFLDEINCVSETLAPAMLQFLQYKIFGCHKVPEGWIIVTAGNPPEYNNSVREFDIATWDRLKRIDVEPDYEVWKEYAYASGIHAAITTFLALKKGYFYKIETTVDGKTFVTARGWSDLSDMIKLYELHNIKVDLSLISQYLQNAKIAKEFAIYYDLYNKYKSAYQIDDILNGRVSDEIKTRAIEAKFDERLSLLSLVLDSLSDDAKNISRTEQAIKELQQYLPSIVMAIQKPDFDISQTIESNVEMTKITIAKGKASSSLSAEKEYIYNKSINLLRDLGDALLKVEKKDPASMNKALKSFLTKTSKSLTKNATEIKEKLTNAFQFFGSVFPSGQEMVIFVTELTLNPHTVKFISNYGCEEYFKYNKDLLFTDRQHEIENMIDSLGI